MQLLDRKFDLLVQLAPAFILGIHWQGMRAGPTLAGMLAGVLIALGLATASAFGWPSMPGGFHPGLYGLAANLTIAVAGSRLARAAA